MSDKQDDGKPDLLLLPWSALAIVSRVAAHGNRKYAAGGWATMPDGERRLKSAALRHIYASMSTPIDPESGLLHIGHAAMSCLYAAALAAPLDAPPTPAGRRR